MALHWIVLVLSGLALSVALYLFHVNRGLNQVPEEVAKIAGKPWSDEVIRAAYDKYSKEPSDFKKYLPPAQHRRYVVLGGSGLVGGWIVEHLLIRGEDPTCIRVADLQPPRRQLAIEKQVPYYHTDVTDRASVATVFDTPWPQEHAKRPLTVFHTAAYIHPGARHEAQLPKFLQVNVEGTRNVIEAAKSAGCDIFIATSSASIASKPINYFFPPWKPYPDNYVQFFGNADPVTEHGTLYDFASCYAYSKTEAEKLIRSSDDKAGGFRTGAIRPGHAVYGHGDENRNSVVYDYLWRGGFSSWMSHLIVQYVSAQNVSLAHLLFEARIHPSNLGGRAYCICDPGPPIRYGDIYRLLTILAHQATPVAFPYIPPIVPVVLAHIVGIYASFQTRTQTQFRTQPQTQTQTQNPTQTHSKLQEWSHRWFHLPVSQWKWKRFHLPELQGDLAWLQPGVLNHSTLHVVFDCSQAREDLGYDPALDTLEGLCLHVKEWNENVEARLQAGKAPKPGEMDVQSAARAAVDSG